MSDIILELPSEEHEIGANQYKEEFFSNQEPIINGSALFDQMDYKEWLTYTRKNNNPVSVSKGWVTATTFFAVRKNDKRIVGMIDVRHNLDNPFLAAYGGHIGYSVRPSERKKGYAAQMLLLALQYAKSLQLSKVMLGAHADNIASIKTILKCGGILSESKLYADGKPAKIYWIDLS